MAVCAAQKHAVVVCDTTPLMTAVYSERIFGDRSLQPTAIAQQRGCAITLLTALDIAWEPDGLQRDGPHVRTPVDDCIRRLLIAGGLRWAVVSGRGDARLESALDAVAPLLRTHLAGRGGTASTGAAAGLFTRLNDRDAAQPPWRWTCDNCDAPDCEHRLMREGTAGA